MENQEDYSAAIAELSKHADVIEESSDQYKAHLVVETCHCTKENSVSKNIQDFNLLHVSPIIYSRGWEHYRVIVFKHEDLKELLQRLEERSFGYEILRKVPFNGFIASSLTLTADALFSELTDRQMDALLTAYRSGYYLLPRRFDIQAIAAKNRVPRTAFQEHLKKAENKIVASLVPYIQLYKHAPLEKRESLRIKNI